MRSALELQLNAHPIRIVDEHRLAVTPLLGALGDSDPGLPQVRDDVGRRGIHEEAEMIYADRVLITPSASRGEVWMRKDVEFLASYLEHGGPQAIGVRPR